MSSANLALSMFTPNLGIQRGIAFFCEYFYAMAREITLTNVTKKLLIPGRRRINTVKRFFALVMQV
ncbi:MAG: hypothetical protein LBF84_03775 [Holosporales bacterium]|nr:hypothetical protein [Holosporales bacterium]